MPPITSPRRSAFHGGPAPLGRPVSVPIPGAGMMTSPTSMSAGSSPMSLGRQLNGTAAPGHSSSYHHGNHPHNSGHSAHSQPGGTHGASAASAAAGGHHHSHHAPGTNMHSPTGSAHTNGNAHSSSFSHSMHAAPYMVALAGWPEPVFVSESRDTWEKKRSRPTTPTGHRPSGLSSSLPPLSGMEFRDGIGGDHHIVPGPALHSSSSSSYAHAHAHGMGMTRTASGNVPIDPALRSRPTSPTAAAHAAQQMSGFPTSSARDTDDGSTASGPSASASAVTSNASTPSVGPTPSGAPPPFLSLAPVTASAASMAISSPPATATTSTSASSAASSVHNSSHSHGPHHHAHGNPAAAAAAAQHAQHVLAARNVRRHVGGFADPRYANNASVLGVRGRSLRVAPAWTTAGSARRAPQPPGASPASTQAALPGQSAAPLASSPGQAPGRRASPPATSASAGVIHAAGARFRDPRVGLIAVPHVAHRAVPEVWPPPAPHVVSEVYPRDPDSPWMWASSASPSVVSVGNSTNPSNANSPYGGSPRRGQSPKAPPTIKEEKVEDTHATTPHHHKDAEDMGISAAPTPRELKEEYHEPPPRERERERERESYRDHVSQRPIAREHPYSNTRGSSVGESEEGMDVDPQL